MYGEAVEDLTGGMARGLQEGGDVSMLPNVAPVPMMAGTPMGGNLSEPMAPAQAELDPAEMQEAQGALMQIIQIIQMLVNQGMSEEEIQQFLAQYGITEEELDQAAAILGVDIDALIAGEQRMPMAEGGLSTAEIIPREAMDAANAAIGFRLFQDDDGSAKIYSPEELENIIKIFYDQYEFQLNKGNQSAAKVLNDQINKLEALKIQMQASQERMPMTQGMSADLQKFMTQMTSKPQRQQQTMPDPLAPAPVPKTSDMMIFSINSDINNLMQEYNMAVRNNEFERAQAIADQIDGLQQQIINLQDNKVPPMPMPMKGLNMRSGGSATGK